MIINNSSKFLDGKECLRVWSELGSLQQAVLYFTEKGVLNPTTKNPPTRMSVFQAAWRWALENRENLNYAKKHYFEPLVLNQGQVWTEDEWGIWFVKHGHTAYKSAYRYFLLRFPEFEKYDKMLYGQK